MTLERPMFPPRFLTLVAGTDVCDSPVHSEKTKLEPAQRKRRRSSNPLTTQRANVSSAVSVFGRAQKFGHILTPKSSEDFEDILRRGALSAHILQGELSKATDRLRKARSERTDQQQIIIQPALGVREAILRQIVYHEREKLRTLEQLAALDEAAVQRIMEERQP
jgi:hypothetical protein